MRWAAVDLATVRDTKSYLARLVTRQALNAVRAGRPSTPADAVAPGPHLPTSDRARHICREPALASGP